MMKRMMALACLVVVMALAASAANAVPAEVKWSQAPSVIGTVGGVDQYNGRHSASSTHLRTVTADDFLRSDASPITGFRWWGSYPGWDGALASFLAPQSFRFSIYTNLPADATSAYSRPAASPIWQYDATAFTQAIVGVEMDPRQSRPGFDQVVAYSAAIPQASWFTQPGPSATYWLSIQAVYAGSPPNYPWNWLTHPYSYAGGAVSSYNGGAWQRVLAPDFQPTDMAFELLSTPEPSGILALLSGLVGVGAVIRRKR